MIHPSTADVHEYVVGALTEKSDERVLLRRLAQGDQAAFWEIWGLYREQLFSNCLYWMGGNREEAEDALSSASLKAWAQMSTYAAEIRNVKGWLTRLVHNHCMDIRRALKRRDHHAQEITDLRLVGSGQHFKQEVSPEDLVSHRECLQGVRRALDNLPPALREIIELRFSHGMSYREISTQLDLSPENARKRVQQARSILRASYSGSRIGGRDDKRSRLLRQEVGGCNTPPKQQAFKTRREQVWQGQAMIARPVHLATGVEYHLYIPLNQKPVRQQQKLKTLRNYLRRHPSGWKKRLELAHILYAMGAWEEALQAYQQVTRKQPGCIEAWLRLGESCYVTGRVVDAIEAYEKVSSRARQAATQDHVQGLLYVCGGDVLGAATAFEKAAHHAPQNGAHWNALGVMRLHMQRPDAAYDAFEKALQVNSNDVVALTHSYTAIQAMGQRVEAQQRVERVIQIDATNALALKRKANAILRSEQASPDTGQAAHTLLKQALHLAPDAPDIHAALARACIVRGKRDQGLAVLEQFTAQHPLSPAGWYYTAKFHAELGDTEAALHPIRQAYGLISSHSTTGIAQSQHCLQHRAQTGSDFSVSKMLQYFPNHWRRWFPTGHALLPQ